MNPLNEGRIKGSKWKSLGIKFLKIYILLRETNLKGRMGLKLLLTQWESISLLF